jgi:hypothetical protein
VATEHGGHSGRSGGGASHSNAHQSNGHVYGRPRLNQHSLTFRLKQPLERGAFQPLPRPTGQAPYRLDLREIIPADQYQHVTNGKRLVFHTAGDLGGIKDPVPQERVAQSLEEDFLPDPADKSLNPAFFYALGDCVYFNGEAQDYYDQFYLPYEHYIAPILAVPGNHDGDAVAPETSLAAFVRNFCQPEAGYHSPDAREDTRTAMIQPNVFWTLTTPLISMVGLYSNVPEHGVIHPDQQGWLNSELASLPKDLPLVITMHHPVYSADDHHSGSQTMHEAVNTAITASGRVPDLILAGHVHNYQRFTRTTRSRDILYIVAGAGGYHNLHRVALVNGDRVTTPVTLVEDGDEVTLEKYLDDRHSFLRLEVTPTEIVGKCYGVPRPQESWSNGATLFDTFRLDLVKHKAL